MRARDWREIAGALVLALLGGYVLLRSFDYGIGPATRMGSGNVPMMLGAILIALALWIGIPAWLRGAPKAAADSKTERPAVSWRPLLLVSAAMAGFCLLLPLAGFLPAMAFIITVCALADPVVAPRAVIGLVVVVTAIAWLIFAVGLDINLPMLKGF